MEYKCVLLLQPTQKEITIFLSVGMLEHSLNYISSRNVVLQKMFLPVYDDDDKDNGKDGSRSNRCTKCGTNNDPNRVNWNYFTICVIGFRELILNVRLKSLSVSRKMHSGQVQSSKFYSISIRCKINYIYYVGISRKITENGFYPLTNDRFIEKLVAITYIQIGHHICNNNTDNGYTCIQSRYIKTSLQNPICIYRHVVSMGVRIQAAGICPGRWNNIP